MRAIGSRLLPTSSFSRVLFRKYGRVCINTLESLPEGPDPWLAVIVSLRVAQIDDPVETWVSSADWLTETKFTLSHVFTLEVAADLVSPSKLKFEMYVTWMQVMANSLLLGEFSAATADVNWCLSNASWWTCAMMAVQSCINSIIIPSFQSLRSDRKPSLSLQFHQVLSTSSQECLIMVDMVAMVVAMVAMVATEATAINHPIPPILRRNGLFSSISPPLDLISS